MREKSQYWITYRIARPLLWKQFMSEGKGTEKKHSNRLDILREKVNISRPSSPRHFVVHVYQYGEDCVMYSHIGNINSLDGWKTSMVFNNALAICVIHNKRMAQTSVFFVEISLVEKYCELKYCSFREGLKERIAGYVSESSPSGYVQVNSN